MGHNGSLCLQEELCMEYQYPNLRDFCYKLLLLLSLLIIIYYAIYSSVFLIQQFITWGIVRIAEIE